MRLASVLQRDGKTDEARTLLKETAATLKATAPKLGDGIAKLGLSLSSALLSAGDREGARAVLTSTAFGPLAMLTGKLVQMVSQPGFERRTRTGGRLGPIRNLIQNFVNCLIAHLQKAGPEAAKDPMLVNARQVVDVWLAKLAFLEAEAPDEAIGIYATAARIHCLDLKPDAFAKAVAAAKPPADSKRDHLARVFGPAAKSLEADLPWVRICPAWWQAEVNRALLGTRSDELGEDAIEAKLDPTKADRSRIAAAAKGASEARAACAALGITGQRLDYTEHFAGLTAALANADTKALRERLRVVKRLNDKFLRDATAGTIGRLAPLCSDAQWTAVLKAWADEVDYKPKWFSIAWQAVLAGAPKHALATARMAASRFKDDPTFAEEAAFMQKLLGGK